MIKKTWLPILLALAAGWALFFFPVTAVQFVNENRGSVTRLPMDPGKGFSVLYHHSIYDQPVAEEFSIGPNREFILTGLRSESGAVLEYFGFSDAREYHAMDRKMDKIVFRVAAGAPQRLILNGREISFLAFGEHGDRIEAEIITILLGRYFIGSLARQIGLF